MAGIVSVFRKQESPKAPLHARWGDVAITVPTDGSWSQFDNPHKEKAGYGPGFVPDCTGDDASKDIDPARAKNKPAPKRRQFSIPMLKPRRLARICSISKRNTTQAQEDGGEHKTGFAYKPVIQDYTREIVEKTEGAQESAPVLYVPASKKYFEELAALQPNTESTTTSRGSSTEYSTKVISEMSSKKLQPRGLWDFIEDDDDKSKSVRSSAETSSGRTKEAKESPQGNAISPTGRSHREMAHSRLFPRTVPDTKKKRKSLKPRTVTVTMVSDPEDLYG